MSAEGEEIGIELLQVNFYVWGTLRSVDEYGDVVAVGYVNDFLYGVGDAEHVGYVGYADKACFFVDEAFVCLDVEGTVACQRNDTQCDAYAVAQHLPGHDVAVMLHCGDDDLVTAF